MSQRSDIDARYNQHLINGHSSEKAWDMAVTELGGKFGHFKLIPGTDERDAQVVTTAAYDKEQADIKHYQDTYEDSFKIKQTNDTNTANAKTTTSTTASTNIQDNTTVTGGESTKYKTNYVSTDTPKSLEWKQRAESLKQKKADLQAKLKAQGKKHTFNDPDVKILDADIAAAELAEERAQKHTTTTTVINHDASGNVIPNSTDTKTVSHTKNVETGTVENVSEGNPIKPVDQAQADSNAGFENTTAVKTQRDTFVSTNATQDAANQARNEAQDAQDLADAYLATGDEEAYQQAQAEANQLKAKADGMQADIDAAEDAKLDAELEATSDTQEMMEEDWELEQPPTPEPSVAELRDAGDSNDWRVRLRLAPQSDYLYNAQNPGILSPLKETDGIIFPYMPRIDTVHQARYSSYDLPHSNYRGYFYAGTHQERVIVSATFTAQDTKEANYLLACLHFLRSCTKMFYGQDAQRGTPPPLVFLSGLGDYQFNEHPCAVELVNVNLPNDVDYIKAGNAGSRDTDFMSPRSIRSEQAPSFGGALNRLFGSGLSFGGTEAPTYTSERIFTRSSDEGTTRVPTKMEINFNLVPIQTRDQVSNEYSLKDYSNGSLLKKGFW